MNPVAFNIWGLDIRWYGLVIGMGVFVGLFISYLNCKLRNLDFENIIDIFLWAFPLAIVGARLYYVIFEFAQYKDNIWNIFNIRQGGLAIHGGLIFGIATAYIYTRIKKIDFLAYADVVMPGIIIAQAIGRWGNFFNQEAHGSEVSKEFISNFPEFIQNGMYIGEKYYHPTFLYESMWNILVAVVLIIILYKLASRYKGIVLYSYISLYSLGRFFIEGLRTDSLYFIGMRVAQLVSLVGLIIGLILIIYTVIKIKNS